MFYWILRMFRFKGSTIINRTVGSFQKLVNKLDKGIQRELQDKARKEATINKLNLDVIAHQANAETALAVKDKFMELITPTPVKK